MEEDSRAKRETLNWKVKTSEEIEKKRYSIEEIG